VTQTPVYLCAFILAVFLLPGCTETPSGRLPEGTPVPFVVDYGAIPRGAFPAVTSAPTVTPGGESTVSFSQDILPLLQQNCSGCHGGIAGMWLTDYDRVRLPSINGATIYPGDPDRSPLYFYVQQGLMPANSDPLSSDQIALIRQWILEGAFNN
jgi:mono/diheme cytochrome c family protein